MARDVTEVIDAMLAHVPPGMALRAELAKLRTDACYLAPECMAVAWARGTNLLGAELGPEPPTDGWQAEVVRIWKGDQ